MGKNKLRRFAENLTFDCLVQSEFGAVFGSDHPLKGRWYEFFGNHNPIVLEIGCGRGEYTLGLSRANGEKNFIGIDIKGSRLWRGAKTATEEGLKNAAFLRTRVEVLDSFFAAGEVSQVWITFPDPQLKKPRKRLTSAMFLNRYANFLTLGAKIHLKTDSLHLHQYTKALIEHNNIQADIANNDIYSTQPEELDRQITSIRTTYEERFLKEGLPITYLSFSLADGRKVEEIEFYADQMAGNLDMTRERKVTASVEQQNVEDRNAEDSSGIKVEIDALSGFCFGVVRAIGAAEEVLSSSPQAYSLGQIVHNRVEVERLQALGLEVITHADLADLPGGSKVLIRAHGEPPSTYATIENQKLQLIDATCPVVASLQKKVKKAWDEMQKVDGQVVILGKKGHSEVVGLTGQVGEDALVVETIRDLDQINFTRPITFMSQTTESLELFNSMQAAIMDRACDKGSVTIYDTICRQVSNRNPHLMSFSSRFDVVVFVSGRHSSNGAVLFDVCLKSNPHSYLVEREEEIDQSWFYGANSVGVCGATSTPLWLMKKIAKKIKEIVR